MCIRNCYECGSVIDAGIRRVPPSTRVAGKPPVTQVFCASCCEAQDRSLLREAQRLLSSLGQRASKDAALA